MDILDKDLLHLWKTLSNHNVRYIMVGGFAVNLHGYQRFTGDVDLWIEDTLNNRKNLRNAFIDLELGDNEALETMTFIAGWTDFKFSDMTIDIMSNLKGLENISFEECYQASSKAEIEDIEVPFLHINHLIKAKKAADRPKDRLDIIELEKIRELRKR